MFYSVITQKQQGMWAANINVFYCALTKTTLNIKLFFISF